MTARIEIPEYPNIESLINSMPEAMGQLAIMYMAMLPGDVLQNIDAKLPELSTLAEADNDTAIVGLLMGFGMDGNSAMQLAELRHAVNSE